MKSFQIDQHKISSPSITPGLYIVSTPIGHLRDITLRALEVLTGADLVACEDTRVTSKLLRHYGIRNKIVAYHEHNAKTVEPKLLAAINQGKAVALVTDAGTPAISDPGVSIVNSARNAGLPIQVVPGPSSPIAALAVSGMASDSFLFAGFLPTKANARRSQLANLSASGSTLVLFESPKRLKKTLADIESVFGRDHEMAVARELTKMHEEMVTGTVGDLIEHFETSEPRGEIVILIKPVDEKQTEFDPTMLLRELLETMSVSRAVAEVHAITKTAKRDLYKIALSLKDKN